MEQKAAAEDAEEVAEEEEEHLKIWRRIITTCGIEQKKRPSFQGNSISQRIPPAEIS